MQNFQDTKGYMSEESIAAIGEYFGIPATKVYGIATFFDYFTFSPVTGDVIRICNGTSCHMQGAGKLIKETDKIIQQITSKTRNKLNIKLCECQGACNSGPIMQVNNNTFTKVRPEDVKQHIERSTGSGKGDNNE